MNDLVARTSRGPRSALPWANAAATAQPERLDDQIPIVECEAAAAENRFQRMAVFQFARPAIE
jgi:hypothetical protein